MKEKNYIRWDKMVMDYRGISVRYLVSRNEIFEDIKVMLKELKMLLHLTKIASYITKSYVL